MRAPLARSVKQSKSTTGISAPRSQTIARRSTTRTTETPAVCRRRAEGRYCLFAVEGRRLLIPQNCMVAGCGQTSTSNGRRLTLDGVGSGCAWGAFTNEWVSSHEWYLASPTAAVYRTIPLYYKLRMSTSYIPWYRHKRDVQQDIMGSTRYEQTVPEGTNR